MSLVGTKYILIFLFVAELNILTFLSVARLHDFSLYGCHREFVFIVVHVVGLSLTVFLESFTGGLYCLVQVNFVVQAFHSSLAFQTVDWDAFTGVTKDHQKTQIFTC